MTNYSKINIVYRLQKWMDSVPGQTFLNYAYSWGASIVILGTLFKLTHLPGADIMLFLGMGTEVVVFFLSAFDRPFDKTAEGRELPTHVTKEYLEGQVQDDSQPVAAPMGKSVTTASADSVSAESLSDASAMAGGTVFVGQPVVIAQPSGSSASAAPGEETGRSMGGNAPVNTAFEPTAEVAEAQSSYVEQLKKLVETLEKVNEQSNRLARDSEEMENLNRTLTGISRVYEMQLKSASQQITTIDDINQQTRKMAQLIEQLNAIYSRMIEAMTVNMRMSNPGASNPTQNGY